MIQHNLPFEDYIKARGASKHGLELILRSPAHYRWLTRNPKPPSPSQALGTATHTLIQEPDRFWNEYIVAPELDKRTKAGKEAWAELEATGKEILTVEQADLVRGMADAVAAHPIASILYSAGEAEQSLFWTDEESDLACKARLDWWNPDHDIAADLKTAADASYEGFQRAAGNFGYHLQAAHYGAGLVACGLQPQAFLFVVVENQAPHGVAIYQLDDQAVHAGRVKIRRALDLLKQCETTDEWPSYPTEIQTLELKPWSL